STNKISDYQDALTAFNQVALLCPTNPITVLALGERANCLLQWAQFSRQFDATNEFQKVLDSPLADATARGIAKVGLAVTLEKIAEQKSDPEKAALLASARDQYLDVFFGKFLRDGEKANLFWTREAGWKAARLLADSLNQRPQAISVYKRLQTMFPAPRFEERIKA